MHNVLVILLHRPFVADGHLYSTSRSISVDSFMKCASAASSIVNLLRAYHRAFSTRRAPYLISYATYVAATIHSRIAARRGSDSTAHANLATCLAVFKENQETNSAVKKAAMIVQGLMKKLGVTIGNLSSDALEMDLPSRPRDQEPRSTAAPDEDTAQQGLPKESENQPNATCARAQNNAATPALGGTGFSPGSDWVDIDGIIQSFLQESDGSATKPAEYDAEGPPNQLARTNWIHQQGNATPVIMSNGFPMGNQGPMGQELTTNSMHPPDAVYNNYQWQQGWRPPNSESASLDDPLFGFNGSSMDSFTFMGW